MSEKTPRERIEDYLELCNAVPGGYMPPIDLQKDIRAVLAASDRVTDQAPVTIERAKLGWIVTLSTGRVIGVMDARQDAYGDHEAESGDRTVQSDKLMSRSEHRELVAALDQIEEQENQ